MLFAQFRYLDGPDAGRTRVARADFATIGRDPASQVRFDPERDRSVSLRHAAVFKQGGGFLVRDLGSANGTFLNGHRVRGDQPIEPNDVLQLGPDGPRVEFSVVNVLPHEAESSALDDAVAAKPGRRRRFRRTERNVVYQPRRPAPRWIWPATLAAAILIMAVVQRAWQSSRDRATLDRIRAAMLQRIDVILGQLERTQSPVTGIAGALTKARTEAGTLRREIIETKRVAALDELGQELSDQIDRHDDVIRVAALDAQALTEASRRAVAVVIAQHADGRERSGSGFALRSSGDTVWIVTAKRLVQDSSGQVAARFAVIFNGSARALRAALARTHDTADVALLTAVVHGGAPVVKGVGDSVAVGDPVAWVGFPGGVDSLGNWRVRGPSARAALGTVTAVAPALLSVEGYGAPPAHGGPVIGTSGEVVGLVSIDPTGNRPLVVVVPGRVIRQLVRGLERS